MVNPGFGMAVSQTDATAVVRVVGDSTGLYVLISGLKRPRELGGDLALRSPKPSAMKLLEMTGLSAVLVIS